MNFPLQLEATISPYSSPRPYLLLSHLRPVQEGQRNFTVRPLGKNPFVWEVKLRIDPQTRLGQDLIEFSKKYRINSSKLLVKQMRRLNTRELQTKNNFKKSSWAYSGAQVSRLSPTAASNIKKLEGDLNNQLTVERRTGSDIEEAKKNVQAELRNNLVIEQYKEDSAKLDTKFANREHVIV